MYVCIIKSILLRQLWSYQKMPVLQNIQPVVNFGRRIPTEAQRLFNRHSQVLSWKQPVLNNLDGVSGSHKHQVILTGFELAPDQLTVIGPTCKPRLFFGIFPCHDIFDKLYLICYCYFFGQLLIRHLSTGVDKYVFKIRSRNQKLFQMIRCNTCLLK